MRDIPKTHNMIHVNKPSEKTTNGECRLFSLKNSPRRTSPIGKVTTMMTSSAIHCTTNPGIPLPNAPARKGAQKATTMSNKMPFHTTESIHPTTERTHPNIELMSATTYQFSSHPSTTSTASADTPRTIFATLMKNPVGRRTRTAAACDFAVTTASFTSIAIAPSCLDAPILSHRALHVPTPAPAPANPARRALHAPLPPRPNQPQRASPDASTTAPSLSTWPRKQRLEITPITRL